MSPSFLRGSVAAALLSLLLALATTDAMSRPAHDMVRIASPAGAFLIDRHEVTVGQFRAFVIATGLETKAEKEGGGFQYLVTALSCGDKDDFSRYLREDMRPSTRAANRGS